MDGQATKTAKDSMKLVGEAEFKHIREHLKVYRSDRGLVFVYEPKCDSEDCSVPENIAFWYCRKPPCV